MPMKAVLQPGPGCALPGVADPVDLERQQVAERASPGRLIQSRGVGEGRGSSTAAGGGCPAQGGQLDPAAKGELAQQVPGGHVLEHGPWGHDSSTGGPGPGGAGSGSSRDGRGKGRGSRPAGVGRRAGPALCLATPWRVDAGRKRDQRSEKSSRRIIPPGIPHPRTTRGVRCTQDAGTKSERLTPCHTGMFDARPEGACGATPTSR